MYKYDEEEKMLEPYLYSMDKKTVFADNECKEEYECKDAAVEKSFVEKIDSLGSKALNRIRDIVHFDNDSKGENTIKDNKDV